MGECKAKPIQTKLSTFRHNQAYPGIIQAYLEPCVTLMYFRTDISRTLAYSEPEAYSEPYDIFRTPLYSERWHIQNLRHIQNPVATSTMEH